MLIFDSIIYIYMYTKSSHIHTFDHSSFVNTSQETLRNPHKGMLVEPAENPMLTWKMVALLTHLDGYPLVN